jgi:adenine phosphoribosyltransferase
MVEKCHELTFGVQIGADVLSACFIIDLPELGGAEKTRKLSVPVCTLVNFEGH